MHTVEDNFKYFMQRDIVFAIDNKIIKDGKLILFSQKDFYLNFHLKSNNVQKKYEIPYPYDINRVKNYLVLDYTLEAISKSDAELYYRLVSLNKKNNSRFFDSKLTIFEKNSLDLSVL